MKKIIKIFLIFVITIAILYGIIIWIVFLQYNFGENFSNKKPIPENEILEKNYENFDFSEKNFIKKIPSNENIFTQGLMLYDEKFYISSGSPAQFPQTETFVGILGENGNFTKNFILDKNIFFGEGITIFKDKIYFLTWKNQKWFILDVKNFEKIKEFDYIGEGWGITNDNEKFFVSNWSDKIQIFDENMEKLSEIQIQKNGKKFDKINELEYINWKIFANIWLTNKIIKINPQNWEIEEIWDLSEIKNLEIKENPLAQELNGIAFDKAKNQIIITGKMWKNLYILDLEYFEKNFKNN